jgi:hypothetical protein
MFRGDPAHTGVSAGALFSGQGGVRWRVRTGGAVRSSPAVTARRVYVGSGDGILYAIDRRAGTVAGGLVIAATSEGRVFAVAEASFGATAERLPMIQAAAEYGLLRR